MDRVSRHGSPPHDSAGTGSGGRDTSHVIVTHDALRLLLIDSTPVYFTPLEYRLVRVLLDHASTPVDFDTLIQAAFGRDADLSSRRALDKHIDRVRSKLRPFGLMLAYVSNFGYIFLQHPSA